MGICRLWLHWRRGVYWGVKVHVAVEFVGSQWSILVSNMHVFSTESSDTTNCWSWKQWQSFSNPTAGPWSNCYRWHKQYFGSGIEYDILYYLNNLVLYYCCGSTLPCYLLARMFRRGLHRDLMCMHKYARLGKSGGMLPEETRCSVIASEAIFGTEAKAVNVCMC